MGDRPNISDAEWEVMQVIWDKAPVTAIEIVRELQPKRGWNHRTVRTMLNRLVKKGALGFEAHGNRYVYEPRVAREDCIRKEGESFLDKVFGGDATSLLVHFVRNGRFSPDELESLKRLLSERERDSEKRRKRG